MACRVQIKIGNFWLSPRPNIAIYEPDNGYNNELADDAGCITCGGPNVIKNREYVLKLRYLGRGSLATAWSIYNRVDTVLAAGCDTHKQIGFERKICDESFQQFNIRKSYQTPVDLWSQRSCDRILTVELHLFLVTYDESKLFDFGDGPFNSSFAA